MQVILLEKIDNLGNLGDLVDVKSGFARNFLLPQSKAQRATAENIEAFAARREELEQLQRDAMSVADARHAKLDASTITIASKAGSEGKLFGSVGTEEIRKAIVATGEEVTRKEIRLPDGPLRSIGEHPVQLHLHTDVDATIIVVVVAEED